MDNAQKAIMIGVGLFITIIIISAVLLIVNLGTGLVDESTAKLDSISSSLQGRLTEEYDGKIMTGNRVLSTIKEFENSTSIGITVVTNNSDSEGCSDGHTGACSLWFDHEEDLGEVFNDIKAGKRVEGVCEDWSSSDEKTSISQFTSATRNEKINKTKQYKSSLVESKNGTIIGIIFLEM